MSDDEFLAQLEELAGLVPVVIEPDPAEVFEQGTTPPPEDLP